MADNDKAGYDITNPSITYKYLNRQVKLVSNPVPPGPLYIKGYHGDREGDETWEGGWGGGGMGSYIAVIRVACVIPVQPYLCPSPYFPTSTSITLPSPQPSLPKP